jgi:hypothetical protein
MSSQELILLLEVSVGTINVFTQIYYISKQPWR